MEKFLNVVRSNNMVQAVLCIAFGLFLMIYPSITVQGIIMLFGVALALMGRGGAAVVLPSAQRALPRLGHAHGGGVLRYHRNHRLRLSQGDRRVLLGGPRRGAHFAGHRERGSLRSACVRSAAAFGSLCLRRLWPWVSVVCLSW